MSGEFQDGYELAVQNVSTKEYANKDVADIVEKFNDDNSTLTVVDVLKALDPELDLTKDEIRTTKGHQIDPSEYEAIMPLVDLVLTKGTDVTYEMDLKEETETEAETEAETDQDVDPAAIVKEGVTVSFKLEPAKDLEKDELTYHADSIRKPEKYTSSKSISMIRRQERSRLSSRALDRSRY